MFWWTSEQIFTLKNDYVYYSSKVQNYLFLAYSRGISIFRDSPPKTLSMIISKPLLIDCLAKKVQKFKYVILESYSAV